MAVKKKICELCQDQKWHHTMAEDGYAMSTPCVCLKREQAHAFLGPLMRHKHVRSELWNPEADVDRTEDNLFIGGTWDMACRHLKWVLAGKFRTEPGFTYRIVDDDKLLRVWLGLMSYRSRAMGERDSYDETYNTVADLVAPPDLLIVRLGMVQYGNKAAPDILYEALQQRESTGKPCWVIEGDHEFGPGHKTWSENGSMYIYEHFEHFNAGGDVDKARAHRAEVQKSAAELIASGSIDLDDMPSPLVLDTPKPPKPRYEKTPQYEKTPVSSAGVDELMPPSGGPKKKKRW